MRICAVAEFFGLLSQCRSHAASDRMSAAFEIVFGVDTIYSRLTCNVFFLFIISTLSNVMATRISQKAEDLVALYICIASASVIRFVSLQTLQINKEQTVR